jgi:large subunit ribosomal protein L18e
MFIKKNKKEKKVIQMQIRPKNQIDERLIRKLREESYKGSAIWKKVADDLNVPTRERKIVNLSRINRFASENEVIVVPGKVLAAGELGCKVTIAASRFSEGSIEKIKSSGSSAMSIEELMKKNPSGKGIRIIG